MKYKLIFFYCVCTLTLYAQTPVQTLQDLVNKKQFAKAITMADSLAKQQEPDYATLAATGQAYEGLLRYKEAYLYYMRSLQMDSTNIDALNSVARSVMNLGNTPLAKSYFQKVLHADTTHFYANLQLARLYFQEGDYDSAIQRYQYLNTLDTTRINPALYTNIGDCYLKDGNMQLAAINYFKAYNANRENAGLASTLINVLIHLGGPNINDAILLCDTALYYNPGSKMLMRDKGMCFYAGNRFDQADSVYTFLLSKGDSTLATLKYAGAARYWSQHFMDAIAPLEAAYQIDSTDIETTLLLGASLGKTYDRKRAFALFNLAEKMMQPNATLVNLLNTSRGETLQRNGQLAEAEALFYSSWLDNRDRLDFLARINNDYPNSADAYKSDEQRAKALFIKNLYLKECLSVHRKIKEASSFRSFLQSLYEEAFFRSKKELPMIAPDGKKSRLTTTELQTLIKQLPEKDTNE
jgi:Flp pilus assembly protein TadD